MSAELVRKAGRAAARGMTLIEIMVVLVILGLIAGAIGYNVFNQLKEAQVRTATLDLKHLFARQLSLLGSYMGRKGELIDASQLFFSGRLRPIVDTIVPLADAALAQLRLERREQFGKIVLEA